MACLLTQSLALDCKESVGGIKRIYVTELTNKATISATGEITVFTLAQGTRFWQYDLREESSSMAQVVTASNVNGTLFYEQSVVFALDPLNTTKQDELHLLDQNDNMVIVLDSNDRYWLVGENTGAYVSAGTNGTGTAKGDRSGFERTLLAKEKLPAREVSSALIAALTTPAA